MLQTKVSCAAQAFREGDYARAMEIYNELAELLGREYFAANLALCQSRMDSSKDRSELATLPTKQLRVAGVMDEFTFHSYDPECQLLQLHPENCIEQLEQFKPHLLFIESAWDGLDLLWKQKISTNGPEINACIDWCKRNGIPTLFWNKEDPVHFGTFVPLAKQVDYVFTTDIDCVPKYKFHVGHDRVFFLPFAAQPKTHNPIEIYDRKDAFNFAGSYYLRYPERQRDFASLVDAVKNLRQVDIYDRNADNPHPYYTFPDEYRSMILGRLPFAEIDRAYKGYRYGINMNTIKQSQTMFARRVYELLASNTVVVSNFSRGVRLMFGDLVVASDQKEQLTKRLEPVVNDNLQYRKLRLLGLRKVMSEHTYAHRFAYIRAKLTGKNFIPTMPLVVMLARANTERELESIKAAYKRQNYKNKKLHILCNKKINMQDEADVMLHANTQSCLLQLQELTKDSLIGFIHADDYYGENYIFDLVLASEYSNAIILGKFAKYQVKNGVASAEYLELAYKYVNKLCMRAAISRIHQELFEKIEAYFENPTHAEFNSPNMLSIDEFNYIENGDSLDDDLKKEALDLILLDQGVSFAEHLSLTAEKLPAALQADSNDKRNLPYINAVGLREMIPSRAGVSLEVLGEKLRVRSTLKPGQYVYLYAKEAKSRKEMNLLLNSQFQLCCDGLLALRTVFEFQDQEGKKIAHQMNPAGEMHALAIPAHCTQIRFGLRVEGAGELLIDRLVLGSNAERPAAIICKSPYLVLAKQYPAYDDLYKYGFLHSRVRAYKNNNVMVDVFRLNNDPAGYREFENIDVVTGDAELLDATLATGQIKHVLVHILDENMWRVLEKYLDNIRVTVWAHGSEIQAWWRRDFEFELKDEQEIQRQKKLSEKRIKLWKHLFSKKNKNLQFVFVSKNFSEEVFSDIGVRLDENKYEIIHNPIDTSLFPYEKKNGKQRTKILSIRSFASKKYANDLSVDAIIELSKHGFFKDLEIRIIGDGVLFDSVVEPLRVFDNVFIERRFLKHDEISEIQKNYGVFLNPTRWDSQGVSRDEAMAAGLVPVTTAVAAVPEFVDETCGILVDAEDSKALADGLKMLYENEDEFLRLSENAAKRVRSQSADVITIQKELALLQ